MKVNNVVSPGRVSASIQQGSSSRMTKETSISIGLRRTQAAVQKSAAHLEDRPPAPAFDPTHPCTRQLTACTAIVLPF